MRMAPNHKGPLGVVRHYSPSMRGAMRMAPNVRQDYLEHLIPRPSMRGAMRMAPNRSLRFLDLTRDNACECERSLAGVAYESQMSRNFCPKSQATACFER